MLAKWSNGLVTKKPQLNTRARYNRIMTKSRQDTSINNGSCIRVYVDQGVDRKELLKVASVFQLELVHVDRYEQHLRYADSIPGVFVLDRSRLDGGDYLAGDNISDVEEIIQRQKISDQFDIAHIYSAHHEGCRYFVTNNPKDFIREVRNDPMSNGRRIKLEAVFKGMEIVTLRELSARLHGST